MKHARARTDSVLRDAGWLQPGVDRAQRGKVGEVRKRDTKHRYYLITPMHTDHAPNCRIIGIRVVNDCVYSAICKVVDGEIEGWPFTRPPTHCVLLAEGK